MVAAEDTRRTRGLLSHLGATPTLLSFHAHSGERRLETLLEILGDGRDVALVTDAGTPGVSDPGHRPRRRGARGRASRSCRSRARPPSRPRFRRPGSRPTATSSWASPPEGRRARPAAGACGGGGVERRPVRGADAAGGPAGDLASVAGPDRRAMVARELTKLHEELRAGTLAELADYYSEYPPRGELTIVVEGTGTPAAAARPHRRRDGGGHRAPGRGADPARGGPAAHRDPWAVPQRRLPTGDGIALDDLRAATLLLSGLVAAPPPPRGPRRARA